MLSVPFGNLIGFYASRFATVFVVFVSFTFVCFFFLIFSLVCQADTLTVLIALLTVSKCWTFYKL